MKRYTFPGSGVKFVSRCPDPPGVRSSHAPRRPARPLARSAGSPLDPAPARDGSAAHAVAHHHGLGRRDRAARRGGDARRPHCPACAVRHQRAARAHERVPPRARGMAESDAGRPREPLPADEGRRATVRAGLPADLRALCRGLGRHLGARDRGRLDAGASPRADAGAGLGGLRHDCARRLRAARDGRLGRPAHRRGAARGAPHRRRPGARRRDAGRADARGHCAEGMGSRRACRALSPVPAAVRQRHRSLSPRGPDRPRSAAGLRGAHAADPRLSPRAAARSTIAGHAAAARLARGGSVRTVPRLLPPHSSRRRTASAGDAAGCPAARCLPPPLRSITASAGSAESNGPHAHCVRCPPPAGAPSPATTWRRPSSGCGSRSCGELRPAPPATRPT